VYGKTVVLHKPRARDGALLESGGTAGSRSSMERLKQIFEQAALQQK
jgi:hypothetical protein